jgi:hypothetical protein
MIHRKKTVRRLRSRGGVWWVNDRVSAHGADRLTPGLARQHNIRIDTLSLREAI